ncbi:helix-turn-helix domain-containing protein [Parapusillimonas granuli]|uniref:Helix-turn-helix domain-containing protein n=1 Tax=Parapusillimonas granuli TaxID=380911 RepID=A0A853FZ73_9BURK|nr:helix-turn-helix transcriptional regulator [Parapusillimonas granuli]MBB5217028.1 cytoskeletal protein RodZ [Parapusillimonas granuli]MEB2400642.1 helix-turn-helix transcriptional regulator [Alcaligenaceae bacterium]NYT50208.1 helix-turn-helix domain-containing protein [Parapusillimonas granuli]
MTQPLLKEEAQPEAPAATAAMGVGATLRHLRQAKGYTPAEVSARLKFSHRQLEALETEQWDRLPGGMSLRGFVKNYARFLEADVDALLVMLDAQVGSTAPKAVPITSANSLGPTDLSIQGEPAHRPWGWIIVILILLFVAGFYAIERGWVPDSWLIFDWLKSLKT